MAISFEESRKAAMASLADSVTVRQRIVVPTFGSNDSISEDNNAVSDVPSVYAASETWVRATNYSYPYYSEFTDELVSTISSSKSISLNPGQINISQEDKAQYIPFEMPRYFDGMDLSKAVLRIYFVNKEGNGGFSQPVNVQYSDTKIRFGWLVDQNVTAIAGKVSFEIHANGTNSRNESYTWKTRPSHDINILESLSYEALANPGESWITSFFEDIDSRIETAQSAASEATGAVAQIKEYADQASASAQEALSIISDAKQELEQTIDSAIDEKIVSVLDTYYTKEESEAITDAIEKDVADIKLQIDNMDGLANFNVEYDGRTMIFYNGETVMKEISINSDPSEEWTTAYTAEVDEKIGSARDELGQEIGSVKGDLDDLSRDVAGLPETLASDYYTKTVSDDKFALKETADNNASDIADIGEKVLEFEEIVNSLDTSPRLTYDLEYNSDGNYNLVLYEIVNEGTEAEEREVKRSVPILGGGGGSGGGSSIKIEAVTKSPFYVTTDNPTAIIEYKFYGTDSNGDDIERATATWKVGGRTVATNTAFNSNSYPVNSFNVTDYLTSGENTVSLTVSDESGAIAPKKWYITKTDIKIETNFSDTTIYPPGDVSFGYTPYGSKLSKDIYFILDGNEIDKITTTSSGTPARYAVPAQEHGSHLLEVYLEANTGVDTVESNHIFKDIMWVDPESDIPVIGCSQQNISMIQYDAVNITYTVYDPSTETPTVEFFVDDIQLSSKTLVESTNVWQYKPSEPGNHTLVIKCGKTSKILTVSVTELDIDLDHVTSGLAFDFDPIGKSNIGEDRLWSDGTYSMSVSENFDWVNGGYQTDANGDTYFCVRAGTSATIDYRMFCNTYNVKNQGGHYKFVFKTTNVQDADVPFMQCYRDNVGVIMKPQETNFYAGSGNHLYLAYSEEDIIEFEINMGEYVGTKNGTEVKMVMGYEDGVATKPLVYLNNATFVQGLTDDDAEFITFGSESCDLHIYRFKAYRRALESNEVLTNFILDARNTTEMVTRYNRNQIYDPDTNELTPEYLADVCPDLRIIKISAPRFTNDKSDKVEKTIIQCIYKNGRDVDNWIAYNCQHSGQGTSSNTYGQAGRNIDLIMNKKDSNNEYPRVEFSNGGILANGELKINLSDTSVPVDYFNIKVNIASSENANNALLAKRYNDNNPYKRPLVREDGYPYDVKDTMEFHNCVVFIQETDTTTDANGNYINHTEFNDTDWHFYGIGNIGDSKKTDSTRMNDPDDINEFVVEIMDNNLPNSKFQSGIEGDKGYSVYGPAIRDLWQTYKDNTFESDNKYILVTESKHLISENLPIFYEYVDDEYVKTSDIEIDNNKEYFEINYPDEASAYAGLYSDKYYFDFKKNEVVQERGWGISFECRYEHKNSDHEEHRRLWNEFYEFVIFSDDQTFERDLGNYCVLDSVMYYYLFTLRYTMIDNRAKNSFWHYGKCEDGIYRWDLTMDYDNDTALGIDNFGKQVYRYGYEDIDYIDAELEEDADEEIGTEESTPRTWVFNAATSTFFKRLRDRFGGDLERLYNTLDSGTSIWKADDLIAQFDIHQLQFPEELWRIDINRKYVRTYTGSFINGEPNDDFLKTKLNGRKKYHRRQFERNQEKYMASKFRTAKSKTEIISLRAQVPDGNLAVDPNFDMTITPYSYMYVTVNYGSGRAIISERGEPNIPVQLDYPLNSGDIIEIESASNIRSVGDLSPLYTGQANLQTATRLKDAVLGNSTEGYRNVNLKSVNIPSDGLLEYLNIENISNLSGDLDCSSLRNLKTVRAKGSGIAGLTLANNGAAETLSLPGSLGALTFRNLNKLKDIDIDSLDTLSILTLESCDFSTLERFVLCGREYDLLEGEDVIDETTFIENAPNLSRVRLIDVDWKLPDTTILQRLYDNMGGLNSSNIEVEHAVITGRVVVTNIREHDYDLFKERWPELDITWPEGGFIEQHAVTFYNGDDSVLEIQYVDFGTAAIDPTKRIDKPVIPTKESTVENNFTFETWDRTFDLVLEDLYIWPVFSASVRQYTIKYLNKDGPVLQIEEQCDYGSYHPYTGATPTYTTFEDGSLIFYLFSGWDNSGFVDGEKTINAVYDEFRYTNSAFEGKQFKDMTPVEIYALIRLKQRGILEIQPKDENLEVIDDECIVSVGDEYSFVLGNDLDFPGKVDSRLLVAETGGESTPLTFTGNSYHNTGVTLFDEDRDFVLAIDYEFTSGNTSDTVLAQCYDNSIATGESGFRLMFNSSSSTADLSWEDSSTSLTSVGKREMLVIRHKKGSNTLTIYNSNLDGAEVTTVSMDNTPGITNTEPLIFGCYKYGNYYRNYAHGNIYWCKLWYMDLGDEVCKQLAIWPHEEITMQACMFENYEYSDGTKTLGDINLIAKNLLDRPMLWNNTTGNTGGWAEADLNAALNTRLYNAFPTQIRSLLKQVVVKSTAGGGKNNSTIVTSVTNSNCYIWLPAAIEIASDVSTYTGNGYKSEIDDTTQVVSIIPESGTIADSRICTNLDGTVNKYWLRSPNIAYPYVLTVNEKGSVYGFIESNRTGYGVRIMFTF